jgi:hypothetical protein
MSSDGELLLIFGVLHLIALGCGIVLFVMFLRSGDGTGNRTSDDDEESGGGGNDRVHGRPPASSPSGGIPLPDAEPSPVRLRSHDRPSRPRPGRRETEPVRPARRRVAR